MQDSGGKTTTGKQLLGKRHTDDIEDLLTQSNVAYKLPAEGNITSAQLLEEGYVYDNEDLVVAQPNAAYDKTGKVNYHNSFHCQHQIWLPFYFYMQYIRLLHLFTSELHS